MKEGNPLNLTYVGPLDRVEAAGLIFERGKPQDVPAHIAGRAPEKRVAAAYAELTKAYEAADHEAAKALREELASLDYGDGLLAQPDNWSTSAASKKEDKS